ncbi:hypothetical protein BBG10_05590 [Streptococcus dysgalactiae subsp. equisimilis]|nr:hypothetical protein BBG10_05590 [Streptococcus dysgalactiae subsp. equisimilis]
MMRLLSGSENKKTKGHPPVEKNRLNFSAVEPVGGSSDQKCVFCAHIQGGGGIVIKNENL